MTRNRPRKRPLWTCPRCGERFTTAGSWHSCGKFDLEAHFVGTAPAVRRLFDRFVELAREQGPTTVIPQQSRIALQARMRFAVLMPQKEALRGHLVLAERHDSPRFGKVETYSPRNHLHVFRLADLQELDDEFAAFIAMAHAVGRQEHLEDAGTPAPSRAELRAAPRAKPSTESRAAPSTESRARSRTGSRAAKSARQRVAARCSSDDVRRIALALPDAVEGSHMGHPDFRVRGRIFASLPRDGLTASLKISGADLDALVAADPGTYRAVWGGRWLSVTLSTVRHDALAALIADAHAATRGATSSRSSPPSPR
jgi:hypothetical protein